MVKRIFTYLGFFITFVLCSTNVFTQNMLLTHPTDSIEIDYRSSGVGLDSIDASFIGELSLRPGAGDRRLIEYDLPSSLAQQMNGLGYRMNRIKVKPLWTGLPYLGFQYAFGSKLNQAMNVQYHHYFAEKTHLHFQYHRRTSNGFLRNSDFKLNDVSLLFTHEKGNYATEIEAYYGADELGQNEGVVTDSFITSFPLEFIEVQNNSARSRVRDIDAKWRNYFRLIGDSTTGTGILTRHRYDLINREFTDQVGDPSEFDTLYYDSIETRDQYQTASIANGAGIFFNSRKFAVDAALNHRYWRNQNRGVNRDTVEAFLDANAILNIREGLQLKSYFYFNFLGAIGELKSRSSVFFSPVEKITVNGGINFTNAYPTPYLRHHQANYFEWYIPREDLEMQQSLNIHGSIKLGEKNHLLAKIDWTNINNGRYFIEDRWRQDTLDLISVGAITMKGQLKLGGWSFYPGISLRFQSSNFNYQPTFSTRNRISYETKIFQNNLGFAIGADVGYDLGYNFLTYNGVLGTYAPMVVTESTPSLVRLNAFTAISIDQFRLFVRAENIDYFINDQTARIDEQIPLMPFLIRIGITWDFFN